MSAALASVTVPIIRLRHGSLIDSAPAATEASPGGVSGRCAIRSRMPAPATARLRSASGTGFGLRLVPRRLPAPRRLGPRRLASAARLLGAAASAHAAPRPRLALGRGGSSAAASGSAARAAVSSGSAGCLRAGLGYRLFLGGSLLGLGRSASASVASASGVGLGSLRLLERNWSSSPELANAAAIVLSMPPSGSAVASSGR